MKGSIFREEEKCGGYAYATTRSMCPNKEVHNWKYGDGSKWRDAGKGIIVKCYNGIRTSGDV